MVPHLAQVREQVQDKETRTLLHQLRGCILSCLFLRRRDLRRVSKSPQLEGCWSVLWIPTVSIQGSSSALEREKRGQRNRDVSYSRDWVACIPYRDCCLIPSIYSFLCTCNIVDPGLTFQHLSLSLLSPILSTFYCLATVYLLINLCLITFLHCHMSLSSVSIHHLCLLSGYTWTCHHSVDLTISTLCHLYPFSLLCFHQLSIYRSVY